MVNELVLITFLNKIKTKLNMIKIISLIINLLLKDLKHTMNFTIMLIKKIIHIIQARHVIFKKVILKKYIMEGLID